jgi:hypothetical protein
MIAFFLDSKIGHLLLGLLCVVIAAAGMYWRGHNAGFDSARKADQAQVVQCTAANATNAATITQLQAANDQWANASKADAEKLSEAAAQLKAASKSNAKALATAQAKLQQVIHDQGDAHAWGVTTVPAGVLDALGVRHADGTH